MLLVYYLLFPVGSIKALPKTYHGTKKPIPSKLEKYEDYTSKGSIYGDGLYTTSKKDTAKGYAGDKGIIYETTPKKETQNCLIWMIKFRQV